MNNSTIGDIASIVKTGKTPPSKQQKYYGGNINWYTPTDVDNKKFLAKSTRTITNEAFQEKKAVKYPEKTLLVTCIGEIGRVGITSEICSSNQQITGIQPKETVDVSFLYYWFILNKKKLELYTNKAVVPILNNALLKKIEFKYIPPLATQKKIANTLDQADQLRQLDKKLVEKYDALAQSLFLEMFGDPVTNPNGLDTIKLGDVCGLGSSKRVFVDELVKEGIPFYRGTEVGKLGEGKSITPSLFITKEHYEKLKKHRGVPKQGDLLMPSICPDGRIWVVDSDEEFYFKDGRVLWVEINSEKMNSKYLRYHLKGSFFANYNNIASGTTFAELKIVALKKMNVFYPAIELQNKFAERVKVIEQQKKQAKQSLHKSEELFHSLLQKAFKGELI